MDVGGDALAGDRAWYRNPILPGTGAQVLAVVFYLPLLRSELQMPESEDGCATRSGRPQGFAIGRAPVRRAPHHRRPVHVYGAVVTVVGLLDSGTELRKARGVRINL